MKRIKIYRSRKDVSRIAGCLLFAAIAVGLLCPSARAQEGPPPMGPPPQGHGFHQPWGHGPFRFGHHEGKVVTGEPYTAQAVTTMTETLADGSHITRTIHATIGRDSAGRTMRSEVFSGFGGPMGAQNGATIVTTFDPVAKQRIEYSTATKVAHVFVLPASTGSDERRWPEHDRPSNPGMSVQTTSLASQTIDGVVATGTETVRTIAAGAIGNDKALQTTEDRWYSDDLQMVLQSTRTDPRFGQTTYTVENLHRTEPNASLFQIPAGYQTKTVEIPPHIPPQ